MKFQDVLEIKNGKNQKKVENPDGKYPIYGSGGVMGRADEYICDKNTVVIGRKGSINNPIYVTEPFWNVDTAFGLVANPQILMPKYLYYFCVNFDFEKLNTTVTIPSLTKANLLQIDIQVPPLDKQHEIIEILESIDRLIENKNKQKEKIEQLVKSRFIELFGDPVENPYGWKQTTLKEIGIGKLSYGSGASACEYDGNIRYVRITDIDNSGNLNDDVVSPNLVDEKYILNDGDILFARSGATVGKSYRYRESDGKCLYAGYLIRLVPNTELVLPDYVFYYTKTSYYERFIESNMKVVAQPNINAQQYGDLTICIPPMELQKDFLDFVEQTDKSKFEIQKSLEKLEILKKSLMQQYFG